MNLSKRFNSQPIITKNIIVFVIYTLVGFILGPFVSLPSFLLFAWIPHALFLIIAAFAKLITRDKKGTGEYFLAGLIILIIGFGVCTATLPRGPYL